MTNLKQREGLRGEERRERERERERGREVICLGKLREAVPKLQASFSWLGSSSDPPKILLLELEGEGEY